MKWTPSLVALLAGSGYTNAHGTEDHGHAKHLHAENVDALHGSDCFTYLSTYLVPVSTKKPGKDLHDKASATGLDLAATPSLANPLLSPTPLATDGSIVLAVVPQEEPQARRLRKRAGGGFIGNADVVNPQSCKAAAPFTLDGGRLLFNNVPVFFQRNQAYTELRGGDTPPIGAETDTFSVVNGALQLTNPRIPGGRAGFCQDPSSGRTYITFTSAPPGCAEASILVSTVQECEKRLALAASPSSTTSEEAVTSESTTETTAATPTTPKALPDLFDTTDSTSFTSSTTIVTSETSTESSTNTPAAIVFESTTSSVSTTTSESSTSTTTTTTTSLVPCTSFTPLASPTPLITTGDDQWVPVDLPFPVGVFGELNSTVYVSINGRLSLNTGTYSWRNSPLPDTLLPELSILPYFFDFTIVTNADPEELVSYKVDGDEEGSRSATFEWSVSSLDEPTWYYHFSASFYEDQPGITTFVYYTTADHGRNGTVGAQNLLNGGSSFVQYSDRQANAVEDGTFVRLDTTGTGSFTTGSIVDCPVEIQ